MSFEQTLRDADEQFYSTFPEAKPVYAFTSDMNYFQYSYEQPSTSNYFPTYSVPTTSYDYYGAQTYYHTTYDVPQGPKVQAEMNLFSPVVPSTQTPADTAPTLSPKTEPRTRSPTQIVDQQRSRPTSAARISSHTESTPTHGPAWASSQYPIGGAAAVRPAAMRLSPLPSMRQLERKPPLACLFCRGRKIACGPPVPGSTDKTCK